MADLFPKSKLLYSVLAGVFILIIIIILAINIQNRESLKYSTPDLIQLAFAKGEINGEERLLYLAYALGDSEKLPTRYIGKAPWSGTMIGLELHETVKSKEEMCRLSSFTQSELRRVMRVECATCDKYQKETYYSTSLFLSYPNFTYHVTCTMYYSSFFASISFLCASMMLPAIWLGTTS